jgi:hypothetical protein
MPSQNSSAVDLKIRGKDSRNDIRQKSVKFEGEML